MSIKTTLCTYDSEKRDQIQTGQQLPLHTRLSSCAKNMAVALELMYAYTCTAGFTRQIKDTPPCALSLCSRACTCVCLCLPPSFFFFSCTTPIEFYVHESSRTSSNGMMMNVCTVLCVRLGLSLYTLRTRSDVLTSGCWYCGVAGCAIPPGPSSLPISPLFLGGRCRIDMRTRLNARVWLGYCIRAV